MDAIPPREQRARREAGRFVMLRELGVPTGRVALGETRPARALTDVEEALVACAGLVAAPDLKGGTAAKDRQAARAAARRIREARGTSATEMRRQAMREAQEVVAAHWSEIDTIAAALLERGELSGEDVQKLCG